MHSNSTSTAVNSGVLAELARSSHPSLTALQNKKCAQVWGDPPPLGHPNLTPTATAPVNSQFFREEMQSIQSHIKRQLQPVEAGDC